MRTTKGKRLNRSGPKQLDRADPDVPAADPVTVAVDQRNWQLRSFGATPIRVETSVSITAWASTRTPSRNRIDIVLFEQLADEPRDVHAWGGHRPSSSGLTHTCADEDGGGLLRHGISTESPPRISTTSWDANLDLSPRRAAFP